MVLPSSGGYTNNYYGYTYGNSANGELPDSLYKIYRGANVILSREYDSLGRASAESYPMAGYTERYTYKAGEKAKQTTSLLETYTTGRQNTKYVYDDNGNITAVYERENGAYVLTEQYKYDDLNQLIRADLRDTGKTILYTYDAGGNITSRDEYAYTTAETINGACTSHKTYGYTDPLWKDLLTSYNGQTITTDGMGNPLNYRDGITLTWKNGRQLTSSTVGNIVTTYNYDISGNRVYRAGGGFRHTYYVVDGVALGEKIVFVSNGASKYMEYMRDENGEVYGFIYDGGTYFLEKNALGDVKYLLNSSGSVLAKYTYDEWGKVVSVVDANGNEITDKANVAHLNPFRYRSYYYDWETGFYYLNSRYYDPSLCRFLNADGYVSTGTGIDGYNMFAYCGNNPTTMYDPNGECSKFLGFLWKIDCKQASCPTSKNYVKPKDIEPIGSYNKGQGYVYVVTEDQLSILEEREKNVVVIIDKRTPPNPDPDYDPNMKIIDSYRITKKKQQKEIAQLMLNYNTSNPVTPAWNRSLKGLVKEWEIHNNAYYLGISHGSTADCDFNNGDEGKGYVAFVKERWLK